ncbi:unnamed protein product [Triticum turgidum subsp. durum]|uniref:Uncharacterized protein n=1 Tax=Triticum turgidum subsp. durum TaxID=4567 RepID=A0A9R0VGX7_TRITD|nr:unnamed protein product [Triticum turgidum subsp. durum]
MALDLPLVNPYLDKSADFSGGVNFAVAGATALDRTYLLQNAIIMPPGNTPLSSQLDWFKSHLNDTCQQDCAKKLGGALFLVGEIGGNDYNYAFFQKRSVEAVKAYVPLEVIELGATQIIIPGNFPIGCSPSYLALFSAAGSTDHDERGCLKSYNAFAAYHNEQLQAAIGDLRKVNADISVVYADYYGAFLHLLDHAAVLGFDEGSLLKACCGAGGEHNFDMDMMCGGIGASTCADPARHAVIANVKRAKEHVFNFKGHRVLNRNRVHDHLTLMDDYFTLDVLFVDNFYQSFRMHKNVFDRLYHDIQSFEDYFILKKDGMGRIGFCGYQKCTAALRMLAYGTTANSWNEYLRMSESTCGDAMVRFTTAVIEVIGPRYLR